MPLYDSLMILVEQVCSLLVAYGYARDHTKEPQKSRWIITLIIRAFSAELEGAETISRSVSQIHLVKKEGT